jgi:hypothetical protein
LGCWFELIQGHAFFPEHHAPFTAEIRFILRINTTERNSPFCQAQTNRASLKIERLYQTPSKLEFFHKLMLTAHTNSCPLGMPKNDAACPGKKKEENKTKKR